ncbi:hypothetical protein BG015_006266 [Linnemannia schmuckeri]|uniref:Uncharacterized protein n=1 Tax=Linnemannia schmuckeri TaxID=64567 RepID=A0A9P5S039_9FUNG|nr:hypothetical protein BG015_006266 [Linnemannia schmuckeri]
MEKRSEMGKLTAKKTMHDIERLLRRLFSLDATFKESFIKGLQEVYSDSHVCRTASDTCIAGCAEQKVFESQVWNRVVVSNNSDRLMHPIIGKVLRKLPRGGGYGPILSTLQGILSLPTPFPWREQTPIASSASNNNFYLEMEGRFRDLKEQRYRVWKHIEMTKKGLVFTGTSATLNGCVVKDIAKTTPRDHPPKRHRPPKVPQQKSLNTDKNRDDDNTTAKIRMDKCKGRDN